MDALFRLLVFYFFFIFIPFHCAAAILFEITKLQLQLYLQVVT